MGICRTFEPKNVHSVSIKFLKNEKKSYFILEIIYGKSHSNYFINFDNYKSLKIFYNKLNLAINNKSNQLEQMINVMHLN
ncbi:MAG: hypothetical protein IPN93_08855 [Bacteroidetes bacterium]|jgi:hypothetical protein|nr:hypothetical protein [Bacteroidota bacterium]MBK9352941.1 hypothetical protein [Bacteroidota bacterium]MBP7257177.1 hypothetical protein [Chitinophagales bacterium]